MAGIEQTITLGLPVLGITLTTARSSKSLGLAAWSKTTDRPKARGALVAASAAGLALAVFTLWPNGEYRPIQPGERGTIQGGLKQVKEIPTGRPGLTTERQSELGGAPLFSRTGQDPLSARPASGPEGTPSRGQDGPASSEGGSSSDRGSGDRPGASRSGRPDSTGSPRNGARGGEPSGSGGGTDPGGTGGSKPGGSDPGGSSGGSGAGTEPGGGTPPSSGSGSEPPPGSGTPTPPPSGGSTP